MTTTRMTHDHDGELVVFLIGMTIGRPWRPDLWLPVFTAMPRMLRELTETEDSGLLGYEYVLLGGPAVVQYWDSADKLYAYASQRSGHHLPAWRAFNERARSHPGAVGIWHETYVVDRAESVYNQVRPLGLAGATHAVPVPPGLTRGTRRFRRHRSASGGA